MPHHKSKRAPRSADEIARIGAAYCARIETVDAICRRFKSSRDEVSTLARRHGWPPREGVKVIGTQKTRSYKPLTRPRTEAEQRAERIAEEAARDLATYRDAATVADVAFLRRRGFGVDRMGLTGEAVRFGNSIITFAELREKADRERRLEAAARPPEPPRKPGRQPGTKMTAASKAKQAAAMRALWADKAFRRRTMSRQREAMAARVEARA